MIKEINHITLSVHNIDESLRFYVDLLGFKLHAKWDLGAYLTVGKFWLCLSLDKETRNAPLAEYSHIAFNVNKNNFAIVAAKIKASKAIIWKDNKSEGESLYFLDPNGHKLEIHNGSLKDRLKACKQEPYRGMVFYD